MKDEGEGGYVFFGEVDPDGVVDLEEAEVLVEVVGEDLDLPEAPLLGGHVEFALELDLVVLVV